MAACDSQDRLIQLVSLYKKNDITISKLQQQLQHDLSSTLQTYELKDGLAYCQDRVTIFRYLLETSGDYDETYRRLIDTTHWRIASQISKLTWRSFPSSWFENGFAFYHKYDRWDQPILIIRLRHFPLDFLHRTNSLEPFVCYMMELARRWTFDETRQRTPCPNNKIQLAIHVNVVVDLIDAPSLPIDRPLLTLLANLAQTRYPAMVGQIYVLNFNWLHQGLWQVLKLLLSDSLKQHILFTTQTQLLQSIPKENLLKEWGGMDDYEWNVESNTVIQTFDAKMHDDMVSTPLEISKIKPDNTFDHDGLGGLSLGQRRHLGLRMGSPFLSSYLLLGSSTRRIYPLDEKTHVMIEHVVVEEKKEEKEEKEEEKEENRAIVETEPASLTPLLYPSDNLSCYCWTRSLYWLMLYVVLRIPFESLLYRHLVSLMDPRHAFSATIGVTAAVAMMIGTLFHAPLV